MSELAFNLQGERFEVPEQAAGWRARKMKPKGAPEVVYGRNGLPLILPIDADIDDLRHEARMEGRFRLDPVDEYLRPIDSAPSAYVCVQPIDNDMALVPARGSSENAVIEAMRMNTELARTIIERFPAMLDSTAALMRAAGDAGVTTRPPREVIEERQEEDEEGQGEEEEVAQAEHLEPAVAAPQAPWWASILESLVPFLAPALMGAITSGKIAIPGGLAALLDCRRASPKAAGAAAASSAPVGVAAASREPMRASGGISPGYSGRREVAPHVATRPTPSSATRTVPMSASAGPAAAATRPAVVYAAPRAVAPVVAARGPSMMAARPVAYQTAPRPAAPVASALWPSAGPRATAPAATLEASTVGVRPAQASVAVSAAPARQGSPAVVAAPGSAAAPHSAVAAMPHTVPAGVPLHPAVAAMPHTAQAGTLLQSPSSAPGQVVAVAGQPSTMAAIPTMAPGAIAPATAGAMHPLPAAALPDVTGSRSTAAETHELAGSSLADPAGAPGAPDADFDTSASRSDAHASPSGAEPPYARKPESMPPETPSHAITEDQPIESADELPTLDGAALVHFTAIQSALTLRESMLVRALAAELSTAELRIWLHELRQLSVPDAVARIRGVLGGDGSDDTSGGVS